MAHRWAVVSGGSRGLGEAIVRSMLAEHYGVIAIARSFEQEIHSISPSDGDLIQVKGDVTASQTMEHIAAHLRNAGIRPETFIACAGVGFFGAFETLGADEFRCSMATNVEGVANVVRAFSDSLLVPGGTVCVVGSLAGCKAFPKGTAYCASKFALRGFCDALRQEVQSIGARVILINPGLLDTRFIPSASADQLCHGIKPDALASLIAGMLRNRDIDISDIRLRAPGGEAGEAFNAILERF